MIVHTGDNKLLITRESKIFHFDLSEDVHNNLNHETDFIIKHKELLLSIQ